jgi:hypothetical protein
VLSFFRGKIEFLSILLEKMPNFAYLCMSNIDRKFVLIEKFKYFKYDNYILMIKMTDQEARDFFLHPKTAAQRQYDALRDYYLNSLSQNETAEKYGYTTTSFQTIVRDFKQGKIIFFPPVKKGPKSKRMGHVVREKIIALRKKNYSVYDIQQLLILLRHFNF